MNAAHHEEVNRTVSAYTICLHGQTLLSTRADICKYRRIGGAENQSATRSASASKISIPLASQAVLVPAHATHSLVAVWKDSTPRHSHKCLMRRSPPALEPRREILGLADSPTPASAYVCLRRQGRLRVETIVNALAVRSTAPARGIRRCSRRILEAGSRATRTVAWISPKYP